MTPHELDFTLDMTHLNVYFLQADICTDQARHIILVSLTTFISLNVSNKINLVMCRYDNSIFQVVKESFTKLFSNHRFIQSGNSKKQIWLEFVLMSLNQNTDYNAVFREILCIQPPHPQNQNVFIKYLNPLSRYSASINNSICIVVHF